MLNEPFVLLALSPFTAGDLIEFEEIEGLIVTIEAAPLASNDNLDLVLLCLGRLEVGVTPFFKAIGEVVEPPVPPLAPLLDKAWAGV